MSRLGLERFTSKLAWDHQAVPYLQTWQRLLAKRLPPASIPAPRQGSRKPGRKERAKL